MVKSGVCPQADVDANWVVVKQDDAADATDNSRDYFGTFHFDAASERPSLPTRYSLADPLSTPGTGTISVDGIMSVKRAGWQEHSTRRRGLHVRQLRGQCG